MRLDLYIPLWGCFLSPLSSVTPYLYAFLALVLIVEVIVSITSFNK